MCKGSKEKGNIVRKDKTFESPLTKELFEEENEIFEGFPTRKAAEKTTSKPGKQGGG